MTFQENLRGLHLLQRHVPAFGNSVVNAFDAQAWKKASSLETLGLRLVVRAGEAEIALHQVDAGGGKTEVLRLSQSGPGVAVGPALILTDLEGALLPEVIRTTEGTNYDILFVTDDTPSQPHARINYVFCTFKRSEYVQRNAEVFRTYLRRWRDHAGSAHLTVVDNASTGPDTTDCGVIPDADVSVLANHNTGGAGGFGRGIYESAYGALAHRGFSHVCLLDDDIYLDAEMFARNTAMVRYLRPGFHLGAPMYPSSSTNAVPARSACFGHRFRGSFHPSDTALGNDLDTSDVAAFVAMDRNPETTGWWWDCIALEDIHRIGLPYPFFIKMDDVEYGLRLKDAGVELVIPFSFWVLHDDFEEKYSAAMQYFRFRNRWILLAQRGLLEDKRAFEQSWSLLVREMIAARKYEHAQLLMDGMTHFLAGPDYLLRNERDILAGVFRTVRDEKNVPMPAPPKDAGVMNGLDKPASDRTRWLNTLTTNNHFLPLKEDIAIDIARPFSSTDCRRGRTVSYWNAQKAVGFTVTRDSRRALKQLRQLRRLIRQLHNEMTPIVESYRDRKQHLISPAFWAEYGHFGAPLRLSAQDIETPAERDLRREVGRLQLIAQREERRMQMAETGVSESDLVFLNGMRNRHQGQRCFVLGNGPSLRIEDLDRLSREVTFAANKIYLSFDQTAWRPTYYAVEDLLVAQNCRTEIMALEGVTKIFPDHMLRYLPRRPNHHYTRWLPPADNRSPFREFSTDLVKGVCWGSTITYTMLQMAVHMGFKEIYLLGLDHSYVEPETKSDGALVSQGERNHFHPDYRKPGERWHLPVLDRLETSYRFAHDSCEAMGVKVWNASRFSKLDVFPRADLDEILGQTATAAHRDFRKTSIAENI